MEQVFLVCKEAVYSGIKVNSTMQMFCRIIKAYSPTDVISMAKSGEYNLEGYWWYKEDRKPLKLLLDVVNAACFNDLNH